MLSIVHKQIIKDATALHVFFETYWEILWKAKQIQSGIGANLELQWKASSWHLTKNP